MSSLSSSQRSFPFSFGDEATLNETQGALETQAKPQSLSCASSQGESKRDPWRYWNLWSIKFAYDNPCWELDRFEPWPPWIKGWAWPVIEWKRIRTTVNRQWNIPACIAEILYQQEICPSAENIDALLAEKANRWTPQSTNQWMTNSVYNIALAKRPFWLANKLFPFARGLYADVSLFIGTFSYNFFIDVDIHTV